MNKNITFKKRIRIKKPFKHIKNKQGYKYTIYSTYTPNYYVIKQNKTLNLLWSDNGKEFLDTKLWIYQEKTKSSC